MKFKYLIACFFYFLSFQEAKSQNFVCEWVIPKEGSYSNLEFVECLKSMPKFNIGFKPKNNMGYKAVLLKDIKTEKLYYQFFKRGIFILKYVIYDEEGNLLIKHRVN